MNPCLTRSEESIGPIHRDKRIRRWMGRVAAAVFCGALASAAAAQSLAANKALAQKYFRLMFEVHDVEAAEQLLTADYVSHHLPLETRAQMLARFKRQSRGIEPDAPRNLPLRVIAEDDLVLMLLRAPARGDRPPQLVFEMYRVRDGLLAEHWDAFTDDLPVP